MFCSDYMLCIQEMGKIRNGKMKDKHESLDWDYEQSFLRRWGVFIAAFTDCQMIQYVTEKKNCL